MLESLGEGVKLWQSELPAAAEGVIRKIKGGLGRKVHGWSLKTEVRYGNDFIDWPFRGHRPGEAVFREKLQVLVGESLRHAVSRDAQAQKG